MLSTLEAIASLPHIENARGGCSYERGTVAYTRANLAPPLLEFDLDDQGEFVGEEQTGAFQEELVSEHLDVGDGFVAVSRRTCIVVGGPRSNTSLRSQDTPDTCKQYVRLGVVHAVLSRA